MRSFSVSVSELAYLQECCGLDELPVALQIPLAAGDHRVRESLKTRNLLVDGATRLGEVSGAVRSMLSALADPAHLVSVRIVPGPNGHGPVFVDRTVLSRSKHYPASIGAVRRGDTVRVGVVENAHVGFLAHVLGPAQSVTPETHEMRIRRATLIEALGYDRDVNAAVVTLRQHGVPAQVAELYGVAFTSISRIAEVTTTGANAVAVFETNAGRVLTIPDSSAGFGDDNPWLTVCAGVPHRLERALSALWDPPSVGLSHHISSNVGLTR